MENGIHGVQNPTARRRVGRGVYLVFIVGCGSMGVPAARFQKKLPPCSYTLPTTPPPHSRSVDRHIVTLGP